MQITQTQQPHWTRIQEDFGFPDDTSDTSKLINIPLDPAKYGSIYFAYTTFSSSGSSAVAYTPDDTPAARASWAGVMDAVRATDLLSTGTAGLPDPNLPIADGMVRLRAQDDTGSWRWIDIDPKHAPAGLANIDAAIAQFRAAAYSWIDR